MNCKALLTKIGTLKVVLISGALILFLFYPVQFIARKISFSIDETVSFGSYNLSVMDHGHGKPNVIIEAGLNCGKRLYYDTQFNISKYTRVISYDHAGIGDSTDSSNPRTLPFYVKELRALMKKKGLKPPFILIGHSLGGFIIRYYTHLYPDEIMGLIFFDAPHEDWFRYIRSNWSKEEIDYYFSFWDPTVSKNKGAALQELIEYEHNCDLIRDIQIPKSIPVLMFTGFNKGHFRREPVKQNEDMKMWIALQHSLIVGLDDAKQIADWEAGHMFHIDKGDMVDKEIKFFIQKCVSQN